MKRKNLYTLLGLPPEASPEAIRLTCENLLNSDLEHSKKVEIRHAREVLTNASMRAAYDYSLTAGEHGPGDLPKVSHAKSGAPRLAYLLLAFAIVLAGWTWSRRVTVAKSIQRVDQPVAAMVAESPKERRPAQTREPSQSLPTRLDVYSAVAPSVMLIMSLGVNQQPFATGSGVVIAPYTVVTNCHVVVKTAYVIVRDGDDEYPATSETSDRQLDLCLLHVPNLPASAVKIGSVNNLHVGEPVYAIGAPHGQQRMMSQGVVSTLLDSPEGPIIQSTASIAPGSSGGGLFTADGQLIGITTAQSRASNTINFAVPIDWLGKIQSR